MIELTRIEAEAILIHALNAQGGDFLTIDPMVQLQAIAGAMNVVKSLQALGYRIIRPLVEIPCDS